MRESAPVKMTVCARACVWVRVMCRWAGLAAGVHRVIAVFHTVVDFEDILLRAVILAAVGVADKVVSVIV